MIIFRSSIRVLALIAVSVCFAHAQGRDIVEWVSVDADKGDITVEVPKQMITHSEPNEQTIHFAASGFHGSVSREKRDGRMAISLMRPPKDDKTVYQSGEFQGYAILRSVSTTEKAHAETIHVASNTRYYRISATGKNRNDERVRRVLDSVHIKGKPFFKNPFSGMPPPEVFDISQIKSGLEVLEALKKPELTSKAFRYEAMPPGPPPESDPQQFTRNLIILRKEKAQYTAAARQANVQGTVTGRVLFKADGTIGEIIMDPSLDRGLAKNCAQAASRIKFLPAEIDGKPTDQWRPISFTFNIY